MKKVLAAALLCAVSSFAAWDKFPVVGDGKGEARIGITQSRQGGEDRDIGAYIGIRYSPMANLEIMATNGIDFNLNDVYTIGARYQIMPSMLAAGVDVKLPVIQRNWVFHPSVQFSMDMGMMSLGSNLGVAIYAGGGDALGYGYFEDYSHGMDLDAGVEVDFKIGKSIIWVGIDINTGLTRSDVDGEPKDGIALKDEQRGMEFVPSVGYIANVSDNLSLTTFVAFAFGENAGHVTIVDDYFDDDYGKTTSVPKTTVGVEFTVKF